MSHLHVVKWKFFNIKIIFTFLNKFILVNCIICIFYIFHNLYFLLRMILLLSFHFFSLIISSFFSFYLSFSSSSSSSPSISNPHKSQCHAQVLIVDFLYIERDSGKAYANLSLKFRISENLRS